MVFKAKPPPEHPLDLTLEYETVGGYTSRAHVTTDRTGLRAEGYNTRTGEPVRLRVSTGRWKEVSE